ncbi:MAG: hypothetical protein QOH72_4641 [Solirubrobacteraceae bacterium]|nr:hypothetical protein [Solirubrobacteraceae bacterium]
MGKERAEARLLAAGTGAGDMAAPAAAVRLLGIAVVRLVRVERERCHVGRGAIANRALAGEPRYPPGTT